MSNKPEWMLTDDDINEAVRQWNPDKEFFKFMIAKEAQKKLLEHLKTDYQTFIDLSPLPQQSVNKMIGQLESMLKELEAK
jgi:hypothetical protein